MMLRHINLSSYTAVLDILVAMLFSGNPLADPKKLPSRCPEGFSQHLATVTMVSIINLYSEVLKIWPCDEVYAGSYQCESIDLFSTDLSDYLHE